MGKFGDTLQSIGDLVTFDAFDLDDSKKKEKELQQQMSAQLAAQEKALKEEEEKKKTTTQSFYEGLRSSGVGLLPSSTSKQVG